MELNRIFIGNQTTLFHRAQQQNCKRATKAGHDFLYTQTHTHCHSSHKSSHVSTEHLKMKMKMKKL